MVAKISRTMNKTFNTTFWIRFSIFNLLIVALIGVLMRYKIGFSFPYLDQKYLQYAHSHFAFFGWISQTLMVLMVAFMQPLLSAARLALYNKLLIANALCAYAMLFSFSMQGYGAVSIVFSTLSVFVFYGFAYCFAKDLRLLPAGHISRQWFGAALLWGVLSSIGTFVLGYMMITKSIGQYSYLASVYWFLHFQYNGWFFFVCMGLMSGYVIEKAAHFRFSKSSFWLFAASCLPAYGLSVLWIELPIWLYAIVIIAALAQCLGWIKWLIEIKQSGFFSQETISPVVRYLLVLVGLGISIKLLLQLGSTIPAISKLAFGFRPIVIAYLHLVLLAITTLFLLTYSLSKGFIMRNKGTMLGFMLFVVGVYSNELFLAIQGIASFSYTLVPYINESLFGVSVLIFLGLLLLLINQKGAAADTDYKGISALQDVNTSQEKDAQC